MGIFNKLKALMNKKIGTSKIDGYNLGSKIVSKGNTLTNKLRKLFSRKQQRDDNGDNEPKNPIGDVIDFYKRKYSHISPFIVDRPEYAKILMGVYSGSDYESHMIDGFERYGIPLGFSELKDWQLMIAIWNNLLRYVDWVDYI